MKRTNPLIPSAPLPTAIDDVELPTVALLVTEIKRASTELMWALHKQRLAWKRMSEVKEELAAKGLAYYPDNEREWKLATGDVTWWRGEVNSRANALDALLALARATGVGLGLPRST